MMTRKPYSVHIEYLPEVNSQDDIVDFNNYDAATAFFKMMVGDTSVLEVTILDPISKIRFAFWTNWDEVEPRETGEIHPVTGHPVPCSCVLCGAS